MGMICNSRFVTLKEFLLKKLEFKSSSKSNEKQYANSQISPPI